MYNSFKCVEKFHFFLRDLSVFPSFRVMAALILWFCKRLQPSFTLYDHATVVWSRVHTVLRVYDHVTIRLLGCMFCMHTLILVYDWLLYAWLI